VTRTLALLAFLVAGCGLLPGIQQDEAIAIAIGSAGVSQPVVTSVREGRLGELRNDANSGTGPLEREQILVWAITLQGGISVCPPAGANPQCMDLLGTSTVYLDHETGAVLSMETSGRARP
jgi:hypothetical protein